MIERQTLKLRGKRALLAMFSVHKVEYVLHGHLHENRVYERRSVRCANAGGTVVGPNQAHHHVNILRVSAGGMTMRVHRLPRPERRVLFQVPWHDSGHFSPSAAA
jgi:predicted phosphodiesterase